MLFKDSKDYENYVDDKETLISLSESRAIEEINNIYNGLDVMDLEVAKSKLRTIKKEVLDARRMSSHMIFKIKIFIDDIKEGEIIL